MSCSWTPNAFLYDFGRPFPPQRVVELFSKNGAVQSCLSSDQATAYEPAAGTGRILVPLAEQYPDRVFFATDISASMLAVLNYKCITQNLPRLTSRVCRIREWSQRHDLIICSSFFHVLPDWRETLDYIISSNLSRRGYLALLGEAGDLYRSADRASEHVIHDALLAEFWGQYFFARQKVGLPPHFAMLQTGSLWEMNNTVIANHVLTHGCVEQDSSSITWSQYFRIGDMIRIIQERCWSSMFLTDQTLYKNLLEELAPYFSSLDHDKIVVSQNQAVLRIFQNGHE
jgi:hypothetical protein